MFIHLKLSSYKISYTIFTIIISKISNARVNQWTSSEGGTMVGTDCIVVVVVVGLDNYPATAAAWRVSFNGMEVTNNSNGDIARD